MSDAVTVALEALAGAVDGMPLDPPDSNVVAARAGRQDGITPPFAEVSAVGVRWTGTGRSDGSATLDADVVVYLPAPSLPVADALAHRAMADMRARVAAAGKALGGAVIAWRLNEARVGPAQLGGRPQPAVTFRFELWLNI